jgi:alcohol dehydrogenase class IV
MQDRPTAIELLEASANFVDREIVPVTEGGRQFQSRVVASVMRIVARELKLEESHLRGEIEALCALLRRPKPHLHGRDELYDAAVKLNEELSAKIRAGEVDRGDLRERTLKVVRQAVENKLRIANPRYLESDIAAREKKP